MTSVCVFCFGSSWAGGLLGLAMKENGRSGRQEGVLFSALPGFARANGAKKALLPGSHVSRARVAH